MLFWKFVAFSMIHCMLAIWSLFFSAFSKTSLNILNFLVHELLKPGLENFEHYFTYMWDECNCAVVWAFFGIAFLWDWNDFPLVLLIFFSCVYSLLIWLVCVLACFSLCLSCMRLSVLLELDWLFISPCWGSFQL